MQDQSNQWPSWFKPWLFEPKLYIPLVLIFFYAFVTIKYEMIYQSLDCPAVKLYVVVFFPTIVQ